MEGCTHIVVGAGIIGSWTAWHLQKSGCKTLLIDSFPLPHTRGMLNKGGGTGCAECAIDTSFQQKKNFENWSTLTVRGKNANCTPAFQQLLPSLLKIYLVFINTVWY